MAKVMLWLVGPSAQETRSSRSQLESDLLSNQQHTLCPQPPWLGHNFHKPTTRPLPFSIATDIMSRGSMQLPGDLLAVSWRLTGSQQRNLPDSSPMWEWGFLAACRSAPMESSGSLLEMSTSQQHPARTLSKYSTLFCKGQTRSTSRPPAPSQVGHCPPNSHCLPLDMLLTWDHADDYLRWEEYE